MGGFVYIDEMVVILQLFPASDVCIVFMAAARIDRQSAKKKKQKQKSIEDNGLKQ